MKRLLLTLMIFLLLFGIQSASFSKMKNSGPILKEVSGPQTQEPPIPGGYRDVSQDDPQVVLATHFAIRAESQSERTPITLISIKRAERQVVAGLNYRLHLKVGIRGQVKDVIAVVYQNLKQQYALTRWELAPEENEAEASREIKVYLVALNDNGKRGRKIGCNDSLVPVTRKIKATSAPLKAAIQELLAIPHEYDGSLGNYWWGKNLQVKSASISKGTATIYIIGEGPFVGGVCDEPRITEQIRETARQFPSVKRVRVFVNGRALAQAIG